MIRAAAAIFLLCAALPAHAHTRGTSYSWWDVDAQQAEVRARVSQLELTRLALDPGYTPDYLVHVAGLLTVQLRMESAGGPCRAGPALARADGQGWVEARWTVHCPAAEGLRLRSDLLREVAPGHLHFVRVRTPGGATQQRVLTGAEPELVLAAAGESSLVRYLALGVEHILSGWDHLAFVVALVLLAATLTEVALIATGFTIAHSLTLAAAVLGVVHTRGELVEALIGFSIAVVAAENLWQRAGRGRAVPWSIVLALGTLAALGATRLPLLLLAGIGLFTACYFALLDRAVRPARLRMAMGFVFGLVHGFGFASALAELKLPGAQLALGLFGFNAGVELGQLLVIALIWPLLRWLARRPAAAGWVNDGAAAAICGLGVFWFVVRSFA